MREAKRKYTKKWQIENRDKVNAQQRRWREKNGEHAREWGRNYYQTNKETLLVQRKEERQRNKARYLEAARRYREKNKDTLRLKQTARNYKLTLDELVAFLAAHETCAACSGEFDPNPKHRHIDHCHVTGKLRGVLCRDCNLALGNAQDSIERLEQLIAYLRERG